MIFQRVSDGFSSILGAFERFPERSRNFQVVSGMFQGDSGASHGVSGTFKVVSEGFKIVLRVFDWFQGRSRSVREGVQLIFQQFSGGFGSFK